MSEDDNERKRKQARHLEYRKRTRDVAFRRTQGDRESSDESDDEYNDLAAQPAQIDNPVELQRLPHEQIFVCEADEDVRICAELPEPENERMVQDLDVHDNLQLDHNDLQLFANIREENESNDSQSEGNLSERESNGSEEEINETREREPDSQDEADEEGSDADDNYGSDWDSEDSDSGHEQLFANRREGSESNDSQPEENLEERESIGSSHEEINEREDMESNSSQDERNAEGSDHNDGRDSDSEESASGNSDQNEDDNNEDEFNHDNEPVYEGAHISFKDSSIAILTFILSHKLTGLCVIDLLSLISLHCGPNNLLLKSLYKFKKYFKIIGKDIVVCHYFCCICQASLPDKNSICHRCQDQCKVAYFIEFPIIKQLENMFARPTFFESLQFRFNRVKKAEENIEEIYDSNIYKQFFESGFLRDPNNVSFFMYFDGISLFKKSTFSIWPIFLTINELKYKLRTKKENTILAGIWFGKSKPNPNLFLQPLHRTLTFLETNGANVSLPNGDNINVKAKLLGAVGDMPAKSLFMRLTQFNGAFSCFNCMSEGGRFDLGNATVQVFPYSRQLELRKKDEMVDFASQALIARENNPNASVYGVKGPTLLFSMLPNMISCMGIDVMHGVFLGAMKTIMSLWFESQYSEFPFSISNLVHIVDSRLKCMKPPSQFIRVPRSIKKDFAHFKASDFKAFFFFYSLVALQGVLPQIFWSHHCFFVTAISILCQESIPPADIDVAEELLHTYVSDFQRLYGLRHLGLTFHQLLHLPLVVRNLGPAWIYSCFFYESLNGELAKLVHGSQHVALQICSSSSVFMTLSTVINAMEEGQAKTLSLKFLNRCKVNVRISENIDAEMDVVGKMQICYPVPQIIRRFLYDNFGIEGGRYKYFYRLKRRGHVYSTETYTRAQQRVSCYVELYHDDIPYLCKINSFVRWSSCNYCPPNCIDCPKKYLCISTIYQREMWEVHDVIPNATISYLYKVTCTDKIQVFPVQAIANLCMYMPVDGKEYLALPVNNLEIE